MPAAFELRREKRVHDLSGLARLDMVCREAEHIRVIMLPGDFRLIRAADQRCTDVRIPIGGDAHSDSALTDENSEVGFVREYVLADGFGKVGVVHRFGRVGPEVRDGITLF
jgi:hypothetical protein